jgi:predicted dehydrogenase
MIREHGLDAVHILTPPATHAGLAIQAKEAGCHIFVEKPMAISTADAADVIAAAERTNRQLCFAYMHLQACGRNGLAIDSGARDR